MLHGLGSGKRGAKVAWADVLAKCGIAVLRIDMSGHGESEGKFEDAAVSRCMQDALGAIAYAAKQKFVDATRMGMMGHSLGGLVALACAAKEKRVRAVCAIAPPVDFLEVFRVHAKLGMLDVRKWKRAGYWDSPYGRLKYSYYLDAIKYSDVRKLAKRIRVPVLLVHGEDDEIVPVSQSERFFDLLKCEKELVILKHVPHRFLKKEELKRLYKITSEWFARRF